MPWGSLLRGVLGLDGVALRGVASVVAPGGRVEMLASVVPTDRVGLDALDRTAAAGIAAAWRSVGFELDVDAAGHERGSPRHPFVVGAGGWAIGSSGVSTCVDATDRSWVVSRPSPRWATLAP